MALATRSVYEQRACSAHCGELRHAFSGEILTRICTINPGAILSLPFSPSFLRTRVVVTYHHVFIPSTTMVGSSCDDTLTHCLKEMPTLPDQRPIYLIIDALDECSNTSGIPSDRNRVLRLVRELIDLHLPDLHICVTSRPEVDIREVLEPLTSRRVSLHDQSGQKKDIGD